MKKPTEEEMRVVLEQAKDIAHLYIACTIDVQHENAIIDTLRWVLGETTETPLKKILTNSTNL